MVRHEFRERTRGVAARFRHAAGCRAHDAGTVPPRSCSRRHVARSLQRFVTITTPGSQWLHIVRRSHAQSCAQACTLLRNQSSRLSTLSTALARVKRVARGVLADATRQLTDGQGRGVHSSGDIGGGHVEAFWTSFRVASDLRTSRMRRTGAQANRKVLQHQVLLHRSRTARALAQSSAQSIRTADTDAAATPFRFSIASLRS
jgi:hypothetical protein